MFSQLKAILLIGFFYGIPISALAEKSTCYGTTAKGQLENGVKLPLSGENFLSYSRLAWLLGRTYVHSDVKAIVVSAYEALQKSQPDKVYVYGETGWSNGGRFRPHKTHQNGLSVDFMIPVINENSKSVPLPAGLANKLGYAIEFDKKGRYGNLTIDFAAMAEHLYQLHKAATVKKVKIWRVIFDPKLQPLLLKTKQGSYLRKHLQFSKRRSWVRHDEHYHVDFTIKCKPLSSN